MNLPPHRRLADQKPFTGGVDATRRGGLILLLSAPASVLFYIYIHYSETAKIPSLKENMAGFVFSMATGVLVGFLVYYLNRMLDRWIPWMKHFTARFLAGFVAKAVLALIVIASSARLAEEVFGRRVFWQDYSPADSDVLWKTGILVSVVIFIFTVVYSLLYAYQHYAVAQIDQLRQDRKQLELQFEALKGQISPHYLFNSLNTISSLLFKDLPSAEQFIRRLAQTYQYVLATQHKKYVSLREELDFVQSYYYLLRIRFQQQLTVDINVPSAMMESLIPPLTLQMLLENAVKHNSFAGDRKVFIYITAQDNTYLRVINTKGEMSEAVPSFKVGLENIRQRYQFLTDKKVVVQDDDKFVVSLPVIGSWDEHAERKHSA